MPWAASFLVALRLAGPSAAEVEAPATDGATAPAFGDPFVLRWLAPRECPQHDRVRGAVEARLGRPIASPLGDGVMVEARASRGDDGRFAVAIDLLRPDDAAHRELAGASDCEAAVEAAALVIAIAIDPDLQLGVSEPAPEPKPPPEQPPAPAPATDDERPGDPAPPVEPRAPAENLRISLGAGALVSVGDLPTVGGHGRIYVAVSTSEWRIEIGGGAGGSPPLRASDARVDLWRWNVSPRGCRRFVLRRWLEIMPCTGIDVGETRVRVRPEVAGTKDRNFWAAFALAGAVVFVPAPRFGVRLGLDLLVPFLRHQYSFASGRVLHRTAPVAGVASVALELRLP